MVSIKLYLGYIHLVLLVALTISNSVKAESAMNTERLALHHVAVGMGWFQLKTGRLPKNWEEVAPFYDANQIRSKMLNLLGYTLESRYQFLNPSIQISDSPQNRLLFVRVIPLQKTLAEGRLSRYRYIIYLNESGEVVDSMETETRVRNIFKNSGVSMPKVEGLPDFDVFKDPIEESKTVADLEHRSNASTTISLENRASALKTAIEKSGFPMKNWFIFIGAALVVIAGCIIFKIRRK